MMTPDCTDEATDWITPRFARFHAANPQVYEKLEELALRALAAGARRLGIKTLYGTMRYEHAIRTRGERYKLNDAFTALYARLLIARHPRLAEVVELRVRRATKAPRKLQ